MKKKYFVALITITLFLALSILLTGCGKHDCEKDGHITGEWTISKEATCTEDGQKQNICTQCGMILDTQAISASGHHYADGKCTVCGLKEEPCSNGHTLSDWIIDKEATCDEGLMYKYCNVCKQNLYYTTIPAVKQHNYVGYECSECHHRIDQSQWSRGLVIENGVVKGIGTCDDAIIIIPSSATDGTPVTSIGAYAFDDCTKITSVIIPDSVTDIGNYAFNGCENLTSIIIAKSVTRIGDNAFRKCTGLVSVTIPDSVTDIGSGVFSDCTKLVSITIPDSVTCIEECTFNYCTSLTSITIPNAVSSIEASAFAYCGSLTSVIIPDSVKYIKENAFECVGCDISYQGTTEQWNSISKSNDWNARFKHSIKCTDGIIN